MRLKTPEGLAKEEHNLATVTRALEEMINTGDFSNASQRWAQDIIFHSPTGQTTRTLKEMVNELEVAHRAFPDMHLEVHEMLADGDYVAVRYTLTGTHRGEFNGIPPTGRSFKVAEMILHRFDDGGMEREMWPHIDFMGLMRQIGAMPEGPPPKAMLALMSFMQKLQRVFRSR
jgi:steroid delta-isomerase-like uncharacterized protein